MCGISALVRSPNAELSVDALEQVMASVAHRGPDGVGHTYLYASGETTREGAWKVALGHRRLSIIDLSQAASQPMRRGEVWLTFNGEIYNYLELRAELQALGHAFQTQSDTEVLLAAWQQWGTQSFARLKGMWAFVLVDLRARQVVLCRDRLGIKPLYVAQREGVLACVSELKQLTALKWALRPDEQALESYLATGYEDQRRTFLRDVHPLAPGTYAVHSLDDGRRFEAAGYWFPERVAATVTDPREATALLSNALKLSVREHLRSDVPVGCALSGGLDSSSVAALVSALEPKSLETFTATFPGDEIDESEQVRAILKALPNARGHFVAPTAEGFLSEVDRFIWHHDEPVGSLSQYAGYCVARLTRQANVPVTLNGQGGDEVLAGYWQSYFTYLRSLARGLKLMPLWSELWRAALGSGNGEMLSQVPVMLRRYRSRKSSAKDTAAAQTLSRVLEMSDQERRVFEIRELYLPRLLKWDDRNFMAFSVEGRYPFLDHELVETALSFSPRVLYRGGWVKEPLRRAMEHTLPDQIVRRRVKLGFETPQTKWVRHALRPALEGFLKADRPLWHHTRREKLEAVSARAFERSKASEESAQALMRAFFADRWLEQFFGAGAKFRSANAA